MGHEALTKNAQQSTGKTMGTLHFELARPEETEEIRESPIKLPQ
jgi:hypothetical protein